MLNESTIIQISMYVRNVHPTDTPMETGSATKIKVVRTRLTNLYSSDDWYRAQYRNAL